jgi:hypothetical protein
MNFTIEYANPKEFATAFLADQPYARSHTNAVRRCAKYCWEWAADWAHNYHETNVECKKSVEQDCLGYVEERYKQEMPMGFAIGWLGWLFIQALISVLIQRFLKWLFWGGTETSSIRLRRFARLWHSGYRRK